METEIKWKQMEAKVKAENELRIRELEKRRTKDPPGRQGCGDVSPMFSDLSINASQFEEPGAMS